MATRTENQVDEIFETMGQFKSFTIRQSALVLLGSFPMAYQLLSNIFIAMDNPHRCAPGPNDSMKLLSGLDEYKDENLTVSYQQCEILVSFNHTVLKREKCIYGMDYDLPVDSSVVSELDLVCDKSTLGKFSQTLLIMGQGFGATFFSMMSDRYGRKPISVLSQALLGICGLVIAYAPNYAVFATFKFFVGAFQQGSVTTKVSLYVEMMTTRNRRIAATVSGVSWGFACVSLSLVSYLLRGHSWRTLQMVLSLFSITTIFEMVYLKESLRWLIANGKEKAVLIYISYVTKLNKTSFQHSIEAYKKAMRVHADDNRDPNGRDTGTATKRLTLLDLLRIKRLLLNASVLWMGWFTTALSFFSIYMLSTSLAGDPYVNFAVTASMEIPNNFVLYYLLNRIGRKRTLVSVFCVMSLGLIMSGVFQSLESNQFTSVMAVVCSCLSMSGASAAFCVLFYYTPENFPTNLRSQALGVSSLIGRAGGMIAPFTGVLSQKAKWAPGIMIGCCSVVVCLASIVLPETRGRELPQTIEDVKAWFYKKKDEKEEKHAMKVIE